MACLYPAAGGGESRRKGPHKGLFFFPLSWNESVPRPSERLSAARMNRLFTCFIKRPLACGRGRSPALCREEVVFTEEPAGVG